MSTPLIIGIICLLIAAAFFWLNLNSPVQTPIPAFALPLGIILVAVALAGCATSLPAYPKIIEAEGYLVECGKPYTPAEDRAGVEHDCNYYGAPGEAA
jgi:TRAP-type C4-dicarboxylate transport system permease small subunit